MFKPTEMKSKDLLLSNAVSIALILLVALIPDSPLRTALGLPFVLFIPGYTLVCALFPAKNDLATIERLGLSIGLSLAIVPLIGLALNYTPWGIKLAPILTSLSVFTLVLSGLTHYRRKKLPDDQKPNLSILTPKFRKLDRFNKLFVIGFIVALILLSSLTAYIVASPKIGEHFTEFYVLDVNGKLADYPVNLTLGQNGTVVIGITNHEYENTTYKIVISLDNQTLKTYENIQLSNEMSWSQNYTFTPSAPGDRQKLEFQLYKEVTNQPYRNLQLWVTVHPTK